MFRRLALVLTLNVSLVLLIHVAQLIGASQPPSEIVRALRLNECTLPCWAGIVPGVTPMEDVQRRVISTGARGSIRVTGSVSPEGRLVGDYRMSINDQMGTAFISVAFSRGRVNQVVIMAGEVTLGDLILIYGTPSCLSSTWDLYYDTPFGRATFAIENAASPRYTAESSMILLESQSRPDTDQNCASNPMGLNHWQGIAPAWRYQQLGLSS
jgi:hypothetical protein